MTQLFQRDKPIKLVELDSAFNASVEKEGEFLATELTLPPSSVVPPQTPSPTKEEQPQHSHQYSFTLTQFSANLNNHSSCSPKYQSIRKQA